MSVAEGVPVVDLSVRAESACRELPPSMAERITLIMDAFDGNAVRRSLEDVARCTRLPRSTTHRILDQLVRLRWLEHHDSSYRLGRRALGLGGGDGTQSRVREAAADHLHHLQMRTGMVVHLAVLDGADVHYLDKVGGRFATVVPSRVGGRAPAHSTALGKAMLAWLEPEEVEARAEGTISRRTERTIADLSTLHQELHRIRGRHGLAYERGECFPAISCVAAAIRGPEGPVAAMSLVGEATTPLERGAPLVAEAARRVSAELFPPTAGASRARECADSVVSGSQETWSPSAMDRFLLAGQYGDWR
ncbi:IclR family transcriptional regulator [Streptomyces endophyticus]|nr:IclR family transcriptional regulator [Streptomyces endophyticus]